MTTTLGELDARAVARVTQILSNAAELVCGGRRGRGRGRRLAVDVART